MHRPAQTIIAPYGTVTAVRDAGDGYLADGLKLDGGGVAWDASLTDAQKTDLEAAGAEIYSRDPKETLHDIIVREGYSYTQPTI